jgi:ADP-ribosylglycohydrolase
MTNTVDRMTGFILGAAVGDALGLSREGLSAHRARRIFGEPPLRHDLIFRRGMFSDDTEHLVITALALLRENSEESRFARHLARQLRYWLLRLPAGVGMATARSILRLWLGWSPEKSGVYSAGNGPAMRSGILGLCLDDPDRMKRFVRASTRLTHTDPKAEIGALAVAWSARFAARQTVTGATAIQLLQELQGLGDDPEWRRRLDVMQRGLIHETAPAELAETLGVKHGVRGYVYETVPIALYCWLCAPNDFRRALEQAIVLGGDTDTVGAIVGGLAGTTAGEVGIPSEWIAGIADWPLSVAWLRRLASELHGRFRLDAAGERIPRYPSLCALPRNLVFLCVVLMHGFRRLLPPY